MELLESKSLFDQNVTEFRNTDNVLIGLVTQEGEDFIATNHRKLKFISNSLDGAIRFLKQSFRPGKQSKNRKPSDRDQKSLFSL